MLTITLLALVATAVVAGFVLVAKRRQAKAQAPYNAPVDQELEPIAWPAEDPMELAERRAFDATVRQELSQCTDDELEAVGEPKFMFRADCDPELRRRITTRQRAAQELLDERAGYAARYQPGNVTIACSKRPYTAGDKRFD